MDVSLAAEKIFQLGPLPVTNSMILSWIVSAILVGIAYLATRQVKLIPSGIQNVVEAVIEALYGFVEGAAGAKAKLFFPLVATFFLFIMMNNWAGLLPGVGSIGFREVEQQEAAQTEKVDQTAAPVGSLIVEEEHGQTGTTTTDQAEAAEVAETEKEQEEAAGHGGFIPLFRAATSDLNTTLALALISVVATQYFGIRKLGFLGYVKHYFHSPLTGSIIAVSAGMLIGIFIGLLEVVSEFVKIVSLSFRLFGNVYAGEAVLHTVSGLVAFIAPVPFLLLETLVGVVQATVFSMLTLVFLMIITQDRAEEHVSEHH